MTESKGASKQTPITITERDKRHLETMIDKIQRSGKQESTLASLVTELNRATIVQSEAVSPKVVTMGSLVSIVDRDTHERSQFRLVFPDQIEEESNNISVLSPIGAGMLGYQVGDEFEWAVPAGMRKFQIAKVDYQPDAANTYHL